MALSGSLLTVCIGSFFNAQRMMPQYMKNAYYEPPIGLVCKPRFRVLQFKAHVP